MIFQIIIYFVMDRLLCAEIDRYIGIENLIDSKNVVYLLVSTIF